MEGWVSSRERLLTALDHREPDRVPLDLGSMTSTIEVEPYRRLKKYLDMKGEIRTFLRDHVEPDEELLKRFGIDTRYLRLRPPESWTMRLLSDNSYFDEWGVRWKKPSSSLYFDPVDSPLAHASVRDLEKYPWPEPLDPGRTKGLSEEARYLHQNTPYALVANAPGVGIFETAWMLRGFQKLLEDLIDDHEFAKALLARVTQILKGMYGEFLTAVGKYIQVVMVSDDLGMEDGPMISPRLYRQLIKPFHKELWSFIKKKTEAYLFFHSCGSVHEFIPDLIELGVDILNPVQVSAKDMESCRLKEEFGDRLCFWGGVDTQHVLPYGSPEDVEREVKRRIKDLAPGGGYILTAVHNIQSGVKPENICRMYEAARKYGAYPLNLEE